MVLDIYISTGNWLVHFRLPINACVLQTTDLSCVFQTTYLYLHTSDYLSLPPYFRLPISPCVLQTTYLSLCPSDYLSLPVSFRLPISASILQTTYLCLHTSDYLSLPSYFRLTQLYKKPPTHDSYCDFLIFLRTWQCKHHYIIKLIKRRRIYKMSIDNWQTRPNLWNTIIAKVLKMTLLFTL